MTDAADAPAPEPGLTRDRLLELATKVFAEEGYASVSVRDLARRMSLTTGAVYAHFLNKADLLVEAIDAKVGSDVESPREGLETTFRDYLVALNRRFAERAELRALMLEGATAARSDATVRERLSGEQVERLRSWVVEYEAAQDRGELDPTLDMRTAVLMLWSMELGVGIIEALGIDPPDPEAWAELTGRFMRSIEAKRPN